MVDERGTANESENLASVAGVGDPAPAAVAPRPVALPPRPVSLPPRPSGAPSAPLSRPAGTPPPPPARSVAPFARPSQQPPPPPQRSGPAPAPAATVSLPPSPSPSSGAPRPPAPSMRPPVPSGPAASSASVRPEGARVQELLADLMHARKELTEKSTELRRVVSERNSLRARLVLAERTTRELSSASRAEAQLLREFVDTHAASSTSLRARVSDLEAALAAAKSEVAPSGEPGGLRRIRGIGPAFERALLGQGITTVAQIAALSADEIARLAPQIKARADRIERDDWVGQAQQLLAAAQNSQ